jgi:hypothetical protein
MGLLSKSVETADRMRWSLIFVALLYVLSYLVGWYLINAQVPLVIQIKRGIHEAVLTEQPFVSVIGLLKRGELLKAIGATFLVNFTVGAFLTTTLPGVVPLIGALVIAIVTLGRGFTIGVTYPEVLAASPASFVLGMGTLILELGAYIFSGAAGINIAIAPVFPKRYAVQSRVAAFKAAWIDAGRIFVIVAILLILGAAWEMTGLFILTH